MNHAPPTERLQLITSVLSHSTLQSHSSITFLLSLKRAETHLELNDFASSKQSIESLEHLNPTQHHPILQIHALILMICFYSQLSEFKVTYAHLSTLQNLIECPENIEYYFGEFESGHYMIRVDADDVLEYEWMSKQQLVSFVYYISGVVNLNKDPTKARKFSIEGLASIESIFTIKSA
jgi:Cohesin loading factor